MTPTTVFSLANLIVLPMWAVMIFLPNWKVTRTLMNYKIIPVVLSVLYAVYLVQFIVDNGMLDFGSLNGVMTLFAVEQVMLAGWIHYLAFDLLIGMWMIETNQRVKIHPVIMAPCLLGTFLFGPIGFLAFIIIKSFKKQQS